MVGTVSFFVLLSVSCCKGTLYISIGNSTWSTWSGSNNGCIPATPKVKVGADMNYYLDESLDVDLPFNDKVWVGYYKVVRVFEYIGCVTMASITDNEQHPSVEINGDPGHCFPGCGDHTIVGVTKTKCYCLGSHILLRHPTQTRCIHECNHPKVSCGYDHTVMNYAFLSIYRINPNVTASAIRYAQNEIRNCLALNPVAPKNFYWEECTRSIVPMCANGARVKTLSRANESQQYLTWIDAANVCFTNIMFPTKYSNAKDVQRHGGSQLWTGMFKTNIVYKYDSYIPTERRQDKINYSYLNRNHDDRLILQFTEQNSNQRSLCDDGKNGKNEKSTSPTKSVSSTGTITTSSNLSSTTININGKNGEKEKLTRSTNSLSSPETITTIPSNVSSTTININGQSSLSEYVIIGVCVSLVLLSLIIVSLACFCWRRNKHKDRRALNKGNTTNQTVDDQKDCNEVSVQNNVHGNNNYFVLEPVEYQDVNIDESYDTAADDLTYDTTKDITQYEKVSVDNVYNQLQAEATYDHAEAVNKSNRAETSQDEIDEMYDKSIVVTKISYNDRHTDNIYNRGEELEDNKYHHLGPVVGMFKTDNVYGVQEKQ